MGGYEWLTRDVWNRAWRRAYLLALRLSHPSERAEDFVQAAITEALDPDDKPWSAQGTVDFASHVCNLLRGAHGHSIEGYELLCVGAPLTRKAPGRLLHAPTLEATLREPRDAALARSRYHALLERVHKDALVSLLLEEGQGESSTNRAREAGYSREDIKDARQRLKRHIQVVVEHIPDPDRTRNAERRAP